MPFSDVFLTVGSFLQLKLLRQIANFYTGLQLRAFAIYLGIYASAIDARKVDLPAPFRTQYADFGTPGKQRQRDAVFENFALSAERFCQRGSWCIRIDFIVIPERCRGLSEPTAGPQGAVRMSAGAVKKTSLPDYQPV